MLFHSTMAIMISIPLATAIASSPLNLGLWILFTALFMAVTFSMYLTSWFGALLFLIYIGGMLIMFAYFIAISPNQEIRLMPMFILLSILLTLFLSFFFFFQPIMSSYSTIKISLLYSPLFTSHNTIILFILGIVLFLTLILVVKLSNRSMGPLRPFFK